MPLNSDEQLYLERHLYYSNIKSDARVAGVIAADKGFNEDSVRGRLQRGNTTAANLELAKEAAFHVPENAVSEERQNEIIALSQSDFNIGQQQLPDNVEIAGMFISDMHQPFTRWDAAELTLLIQDDIKAKYVTAGNDLVDNDGYGRWDDTRPVRGKLWASDQANVRKVELAWYRALKSVSPPDVQMLELMGNHDVWYYRYLRDNTPQTSEQIIADYMEWKYDVCNLLVFSKGSENVIELSPNLVWWHGQFASSRAYANATSTLEHFMANGIARSVTVGHTHRPAHVDGSTVKFHGVNFYNSPCLSRIDAVPYMKRQPKGWKLGITVNYFVPHTRSERGYIIEYQERGDALVANFNGKEYKVKLDTRTAL